VLLLGIVVFAAFGFVVGYAYLKGLPGIGGEPPLIKADLGRYRHAPSDRGGLEVANTNSSIVTVLRPQTEPPRVERLLPPEGATSLESPEPEDEIEPSPPAESVARLTTPETNSAAPAVDTAESAATATGDEAPWMPYPRSKPTPPGALAPEAAISAVPEVEPAAAPPESAPQQLATPEPAEPPTAVALPEPAPPPAAAAPVVEAPAAAPQRLARVDTTTARQAIGSGIYRLQLVAVRSEGGLTQAWADLRQRHPALNAVNPQVERTDTSSGPLFRLQAGPFTSREAAANACGSIRAAGGQCFIVGPIGG
jgi:hypothetical protein